MLVVITKNKTEYEEQVTYLLLLKFFFPVSPISFLSW